MKHIIGYFLVALPLIAFYGFIWYKEGIKVMLGLLIFTATILGIVVLGAHLITSP